MIHSENENENSNENSNERDSVKATNQSGRQRFPLRPILDFFERWSSHFLNSDEAPLPEPPETIKDRVVFLFILKILPWVALFLFLVTLFFDLEGSILLPWRSEPVLLDGLLRMISVTGLVGFATNWLAIHMLFHPRERRPLLGQGLIPSRKDRIVWRLADSIFAEIINADLILEQIRKSGLIEKHRRHFIRGLRVLLRTDEFREDALRLSRDYIDAFLRSPEFQERLRELIAGIDFENLKGFEGGMIRLYRMVRGDQVFAERLQEMLGSVTFRMSDFEDSLYDYLGTLPDTIEENSEEVEHALRGAVIFFLQQINVRRVIIENLSRFDEMRLENLLKRTTSDQLQYIQYLGCFLGLIGGLFIWLPFESALVTLFSGGIVFLIDEILLRQRRRRKLSTVEPLADEDAEEHK